jgi:membrane fusion protein (multidrug efflux system)
MVLSAAMLLAACGPEPETPGRVAEASPPKVIVTEARTHELRREILALGTTLAREAVDITARVTSVVTAVEFVEGQEVKTGRVLVRLDGTEAEAELALAQAALKETRSRFNRSEALAASGTVSEFQLDELAARLEADEAAVRAASARLDATVIRAPFDGQVGLRRVSVGSVVGPGDLITTLDDLGRLLVDFAISETALGAVRVGMDIEAHAPAWSEDAFLGRVVAVDTRVDVATRTVTVRGELPNEDRRLRPGMFLEVALLGEPRPAIVIPEQAIVPSGERHYVYLVEDGLARRTEVELGVRRPGSVEIVAGLAAGDVVIVEGTQKASDAAPVRPVPSADLAELGR